MDIDAAKIAEIMGGRRVLEHDVGTQSELQEVVEEGLPVTALNKTVEYVTGSTRAAMQLRERLIPRATLSRRTRLKPTESERVERIARVMALAEHVWESRDEAREFLREPHPALDERTPLEVAQTELGARRVERLLMKLEYGLPT
jgi:putative toxin-antitoxin system antitoxin component (TIGR02293 family)